MQSVTRVCWAVGCLVLCLPAGEAPGAEDSPPSGVSGYDCAACVEVPKGAMPILVLTDSGFAGNQFGCYLVEILRSEGLVEFEHAERSALFAAADPEGLLASYEVVVAAEMDFTPAEERLLGNYVEGGGALVAMRPSTDLADLFGVRVVGTRAERLLQYFGIDLNAPLAKGVVEQSLQYHGEATDFALDGATALAYLYEDRDTPSSNPAVTIHRHGKGSAVAFAFDLAKSVVLTRQGNPDWQNSEGDTMPGYRPMDLFLRPDGRCYFDLHRLAIPQADEKQRLLANLIIRLIQKPLPRMWYLPGMHKVIVINTGDGEGNYGPQITPALDACASYGGRFSVYLMNRDTARGIELTTVEEEAAWRAAGHEVGVHVYGGGAEGEGASDALRGAYGKIVADLEDKFGHRSRTARNHTLDWTGWVQMAKIEAKFGTGMDMNYCHYIHLESLRRAAGYLTGTGLPQRFIDAQGRMLPIYQATSHWLDEFFVYNEMTPDQAAQIVIRMIQAANEGHYSAFAAGIHPCRFTGYGGRDKITPVWPHTVWKYCRDQGIPLWSAEMLLDFVDARSRVAFENIAWRTSAKQKGCQLTFDFRTPVAGQDLTIMVPRVWSGRTLRSITAGDGTVEFTPELVKGIEYGMFTTTAAEARVVAKYE